MENEVLRSESEQKRSFYVNVNGSNKKIIKPEVDDVKEKVFNKLQKTFDKLINSELCVFSNKNTLLDLVVRNEAEMALLQNYRTENYNSNLNKAKRLYKRLIKK